MTKLVIPKLSFVPPEDAEWVNHNDRTRSPVVTNIMCRGVRVGIIWTNSWSHDYTVWWNLSGKRVPTGKMQCVSVNNKNIRSAMNSATRIFHTDLKNAMRLLTQAGDTDAQQLPTACPPTPDPEAPQ